MSSINDQHVHILYTFSCNQRCAQHPAGLQSFLNKSQRGQWPHRTKVKKPRSKQLIRKDMLDGEDLVYIGRNEYLRVRSSSLSVTQA
jgi:hypothetical protein